MSDDLKIRDLTILVSIDAQIAELGGLGGGATVPPPDIDMIRDTLMEDLAFGDYIVGVALMAERERPMTEKERKVALSGNSEE